LQGKPAPSQFVSNITISDVTGSLRAFGRITGPDKSTIQNVTFKNINVTLKAPTVVTKNVKNLKFDNVKINGAAYTGDAQTDGAHNP
jgi:hypothetical protein